MLLVLIDCLGSLILPRNSVARLTDCPDMTLAVYPGRKATTTTTLRPDFMLKLVHRLAFGTPKFYIAPYDEIHHGFVNSSCNCNVKLGVTPQSFL